MAVGMGARATLPRGLRAPLYRAFSKMVGARVDEAELPLDEYPSLGEFFARRLRPGTRELDLGDDVVISPADGVIAAAGTAAQGHMIQAKGISYSLADLLDDPLLAGRLEGGAYATIYLSPRDYHRVHAPVAGRLRSYRHIPGALWPVNALFSRSIDRLLCVNERVVLELEMVDANGGHAGVCALVLVAAVGVSNISLIHAGGVVRGVENRSHQFEVAPEVGQGDELGAFLLGSTVVMIFDAQAARLARLAAGDLVRVGERLGLRKIVPGGIA